MPTDAIEIRCTACGTVWTKATYLEHHLGSFADAAWVLAEMRGKLTACVRCPPDP
jgi:hypothetical protein